MKIHLSLFTSLAVLTTFATADDKAGDHSHDHEHAAGHHPTVFIPETLPDLWAHLNAYGKVVADSAAAGDIDTLHKQQTNLEALVAALSGLSGDLDDSKKKRVEGMIGNTKRALGKLHEVTDAPDTKGAQRAAKSLTGVLMLLKAQYPKDVTGGMAEVKDDIGAHEGMLAAFNGPDGKPAGVLELKLHDDKGDLELWLYQDTALSQPHDLPAASKLIVSFQDAKNDSATLSVRNMDKNEDEDGAATMRDGKTNYFIFPGNSGADATWLMGKDFKATVTVGLDGVLSTESFLLIPHGGHGHHH